MLKGAVAEHCGTTKNKTRPSLGWRQSLFASQQHTDIAEPNEQCC